MSKLKWDEVGERIAETGIKNGILFPFVVTDGTGAYGGGVVWNGLTSVNEAPTGGEANPFYADNQKYLEVMSEEEFAGSIGCFTYPDEFKACIGEKELVTGISIAQQARSKFAFCYRTEIANDTNGMEHGFKIHIIYNAMAGVSNRDHTTVNETPEFEELTFDITTTKVSVDGGKPTSHLIIDSTKIPAASTAKLQELLDTLYGTDGTPEVPAIIGTGTEQEPEFPAVPAVPGTESRFLLPDEVAAIFAAA